MQCEFSMDEDFRPWLIDVHTNPALDTYCVALEKVLPWVVEDVLRHTVDVLFPPPLEWPESKHHLLAAKGRENGFMLVFDEATAGQQREVEELDGVESDRDVYVDDLLVDDSEEESSQRLAGFEYLLSEGND